MAQPKLAICADVDCDRVGRWPVPPRGKTWCDAHLVLFIERCDARAVQLGSGPGDVFRTRHNPCGAIVDVTLPMVRRGGWVCQWCKNEANQVRTAHHTTIHNEPCSIEQQDAVLAAAGMRPLLPLVSQRWGDPMNVECLVCGAAQVDSTFGISEGIRLSWLPCHRCNSQRFAVTAATVADRLERVGMRLLSEWAGDKAAHLDAECRRCGLSRSISWQALASGSPPCLRCDAASLDPALPHRVYLIDFPQFGTAGVYKVGITHSQHDRRLRDHEDAGGRVIATITVPDRASAYTVERAVLADYVRRAPVDLPSGVLPRGGRTECWDAFAGYPDLAAAAASSAVAVLDTWR